MLSVIAREFRCENKLPNLHDWEIVGILIDRFDSKVEITLAEPWQEKRVTLLLGGVSKFYMSNVFMQNVILDIWIFKRKSDSDYFKHCCYLLRVNVSYFEGEGVNKIICFEPSLGAEIACCYEDLYYRVMEYLAYGPKNKFTTNRHTINQYIKTKTKQVNR